MSKSKAVHRPWWCWVLITIGLLHSVFCLLLFVQGISEMVRYMNRSGATAVEWLLDFGIRTHESSDFSYATIMYGAGGIPLIPCLVLLLIGTRRSLKVLKLCLIPCLLVSLAPTVLFAGVRCFNIGSIGFLQAAGIANFLCGSIVGYLIVALMLRRGSRHLKQACE
ncbi:MAG: hypothetical protein LBJ48_05495 [Coriobacteriales bacterium]|jgi:hypothetical protein|nr:hypothetical protein [Coriobacteriales bacterium]